MDEKLMIDLLGRYKELAYSRRATLRAIIDIIEAGHMPPDEKLGQISTLITAVGITAYSRENPIDRG